MNIEKKLILIIFTAILLIFVLFFTIVKPSFMEMRKLAENIKKQQMALEELYQKGKTLSRVKEDLKEIEEKNSILENVFLSEKKELDFITTLEKLSTESNITQDVSLGTKQDFENNYRLIPAHLSLQTSYNNLIKYLQLLENLNFYFNINSLNIVILPGQEGLLSVTIEANTYWRKIN